MEELKKKISENKNAIVSALRGNSHYRFGGDGNTFRINFEKDPRKFHYEITLILIDGNIWQYRYYNPECPTHERWVDPEEFMQTLLKDAGIE